MDPATRGTCVAAGCLLDSLCGVLETPADVVFRYCAGHAWRSWAWTVDLSTEPVREAVEARRERAAEVIAGGGDAHDRVSIQALSNQAAIAIGECGEAAARKLLGGTLSSRRKDGDLLVRGEPYDVKTSSKRWPFMGDVPPAAAFNARFWPPKNDVILCASPSQPECFERVLVVGWIEKEILRQIAKGYPWGWLVPWDPKHWRRIEELM